MFEYNIIDCKERTSPNENVNYNIKYEALSHKTIAKIKKRNIIRI